MIIEVVPYNPQWPAKFEQEAAILESFLGGIANTIHHMGSTAVPGLMAKPIIDILLEVKDVASLETKKSEFEKLGYEVMGEMGIPGRRYFRKGGNHRTHHIHAFASGDPNVARHLAFRDYLIAFPDIAMEYGKLKAAIAEKIKDDIGKYSDEKDPFIKLHEPKALAWYTSYK